MRVGIVGGGVAGSYLARLLSVKHRVTVYERQNEKNYKAVCAWAASRHPMKKFSQLVGLDFDSYILHEGRYFTVVFGDIRLDIKATGLVTFDKESFEKDLRKGINVMYGVHVRGSDALQQKHDIIIDSTGFYRGVIGPAEEDVYIPTSEYMVRYRELPFDDFYALVFPGLTGFLWFFPLGRHLAHVGAGDLEKKHVAYLERFLEEHKPEEIVRRVGRPVRLSSPSMTRPLAGGRIYAVGESAGVVFPTTGEGIIPSLQNAELFARILEEDRLPAYEEEMNKFYKLHNKIAEVFFGRLLKGDRGVRVALQLALLALEFRRNSKRFGLKPGVLPLVRAMVSYAGEGVLASFK